MNKKTSGRSSLGKKQKMKNRMSRILFYGLFGLFILVLVAANSVENVYALTNPKINNDNLQGFDSATCVNFDYWMETFSIQTGELKKVIIDKTFFQDEEIYPFNQTEIIYGLTLSGSIQLYNDTSLIRVILFDNDSNEYLIYEAYPLIVTNDSFSVMNVCEETCLLDSIIPYSLKIEVVDASIHIDELYFSDSPIGENRDIAESQEQIKESQDAVKIKEINNQIKKKGLKWIAGETSVSRLFYAEKMKLFARDKVPNLQGIEYYKGGIFEIKSGENSSLLPTNSGSSSVIESFDWRNRHGANDPDSPYYDGDLTRSGWITSVTRQGCGDCWAHSAVGATEALANLYFNQHLDEKFALNLSEQDVLSCSGKGSCGGGSPGGALYYIAYTGVVDEACFLYTGSDKPCENKCSNPDEIIKINGNHYINPHDGEENIKRNLIDHGPLNLGIVSWWHSMVLVGYDKDPEDEETIWILKNSWGSSWGENGYGRMKIDLSNMYLMYALQTPVISLGTPFEIACYDMDGDGYYNWGISENKPSSCPEGVPLEKDCDDSNPLLGPFDTDGYCIALAQPLVVSCDNSGIEQNAFDLSEDVYCYGGNLPSSILVDIYIVNNKDVWKDSDALTDVSGGYETETTGDDESISSTLIWGSPLTLGSYDIVVDTNQNGEWNKGEPIDDKVNVGFEAIPEFTTIAIPVAAILGLMFLFSRRKRKE